jgi:DNA-binding HxlR family transcriptional regulator
MKNYGQFCPVAKAAEIVAERWTPLILREMMMGARRFSEIQSGVPLMSRTMLVQRLNELVESGTIEARRGVGRGHDYVLTEAGEAFRPVIEAMSSWGQSWGQGRLGPKDVDAEALMWNMRRHIDPAFIRRQRLTVRFEFSGMPAARVSRRTWWLVIGPGDVEVCFKNPGYDVNVVVIADLYAFTRTWLGYSGLADVGDQVRFEGTRDDVTYAREILNVPDKAHHRHFVFQPRMAGVAAA